MAARNGTALRKRGVPTADCNTDCHCHVLDKRSATLFKNGSRFERWRAPIPILMMMPRVALMFLLVTAVLYITLHSNNNNHNGNTSTTTHVFQPKPAQKRARFPKYGSPEFEQQCNWTIPSSTDREDPPCSILVRPPVKSNEGVADWASQITRGFMQARQAGCKIIFDYGVDVDISQVLEPFPSVHSVLNWTVPHEVKCNEHCQRSVSYRVGDWSGRPNPKLVPYYRHFFTFTHDWYYRGDFPHMPQVFPGFDIETGMACALGNLFHLSPKAAQFEPSLFTTLLPSLHDPDALVIALYMRTNRADVMAVNELKNESVKEELRGKYNSTAESFGEMAKCLEEQYLTGLLEPGIDIQKVVWIVLSDSPEAKRTVVEAFTNQDANGAIPVEKQQFKNRVIPRTVLMTGARGIHVRSFRKPSTDEFAEAFLDWFLIGESDVVVTDQSSSFGPTAAMRTNRPIYRGPKCDRPLSLIHEVSEKTVKKNNQ